jgi:Fe-S cluster biosynthesis and repair protein YggX
MTRTVFCRKHQKELEGLAQLPFPGVKGQEVFENVSKQAWQEWIAHQTTLINEKRLNMMDPTARSFLQTEMMKFFNNEEVEQAEGYVAPEKD